MEAELFLLLQIFTFYNIENVQSMQRISVPSRV